MNKESMIRGIELEIDSLNSEVSNLLEAAQKVAPKCMAFGEKIEKCIEEGVIYTDLSEDLRIKIGNLYKNMEKLQELF